MRGECFFLLGAPLGQRHGENLADFFGRRSGVGGRLTVAHRRLSAVGIRFGAWLGRDPLGLRRFPPGQGIIKRGGLRVEHRLEHGDLFLQLIHIGLLRGGRQRGVFLRANRRLLEVGEECAEAVKIPRRERIELVIVTLGAAKRGGHPDSRDIAHAVAEINCDVFLGLRTAFARGHVQPVVAGGDELPPRRAGQLVAGELLARELVERQVVVEGVDDVLAVERLGLFVVGVVAHRVGVAHEVEPVNRHALAVMRTGQQPVDQFAKGARRRVGDKRPHLFPSRRQPGEVERQAADQRTAVGLPRRLVALVPQRRQHEPVDVVEDERVVFDAGWQWDG